jgi:hypothetical protein
VLAPLVQSIFVESTHHGRSQQRMLVLDSDIVHAIRMGAIYLQLMALVLVLCANIVRAIRFRGIC